MIGTKEENLKTMSIIREKERVLVRINNNKEYSDRNLDLYQYNIFIKNILYDGRSKIDRQGLDTKDRLGVLFAEIRKTFDKKVKMQTYEYSMLKLLEKEAEER